MRVLLSVLILCLVLSIARGDYNSCDYTASDGVTYFDFSSLSGIVESYENPEDGSILYVSVCGALSSDYECSYDSAVCFVQPTPTEDTKISLGAWTDTLFSDLMSAPIGDAPSYILGVELTYAPGDICDEYSGKQYKTIVQLICDEESYDTSSMSIFSVNKTTDCDTVITVGTAAACGSAIEDGVWADDGDTNYHHVHFVSSLFSFFLLTCLVSALCICCACCCVRRRRCQMQRHCQRQRQCQRQNKQEMTQFSNVAFQPVAQQEQTAPVMAQVAPQQTIPAFYPMQQFGQPPMYYFYPPAPQVQQKPVQQVNNNNLAQQAVSDEQLARDLQKQFDAEARRV